MIYSYLPIYARSHDNSHSHSPQLDQSYYYARVSVPTELLQYTTITQYQIPSLKRYFTIQFLLQSHYNINLKKHRLLMFLHLYTFTRLHCTSNFTTLHVSLLLLTHNSCFHNVDTCENFTFSYTNAVVQSYSFTRNTVVEDQIYSHNYTVVDARTVPVQPSCRSLLFCVTVQYSSLSLQGLQSHLRNVIL